MNEFLSLRNSNRPKTTEEVEAYVSDEKDRTPYAGAGSLAARMKHSSKTYRPTSARARMSEGERKQFAAANLEPVVLSPEEQAHLDATVEQALQINDFREAVAKAVKQNQPLDDLWSKSGMEGDSPFFVGFERDGDPTGAPQEIIAAWRNFAQSEVFRAYWYDPNVKDKRYQTAEKVMNTLFNFMQFNLVNMTLASSWAQSFGLLQNVRIFPKPVPTEAQRKQAERNLPAQDGNPTVINDATGEPVTYTFKDGRVVRYSKQMLDQLNAESYAKVLGIRKSPGELQENEEQRRQRKAREYREVKVHGGYSQKELDAMPSEQYRIVMELSRNERAMKPFSGL